MRAPATSTLVASAALLALTSLSLAPSWAETPVPSPTVSGRPAGPTPPAEPVDIYATPGTYLVNGRTWNTTCEAYSTVHRRCWTNIWATQVTLKEGRYVQKAGWYFNNLTYPADLTKAQWGNNPLAATGSWVDASGRSWRTECGTSLTGPTGCRTWVQATVIVATQTPSGWSYRQVTQWTLNNMLRFKTA